MCWNNALPDVRMGSCLSKHTLEPCLSSTSLVHFFRSYAAFVWSREALLYFISEVYSYFDAVTLFVGTTSFFFACNLKPSPSLLPHLFLPSSDTNRAFIRVSLHRGAGANLAHSVLSCLWTGSCLWDQAGGGGRRRPRFLFWPCEPFLSKCCYGRGDSVLQKL